MRLLKLRDFPMHFGSVVPLNQKSYVFAFGDSKKAWSCRDYYSIIPSKVLIKQYLGIHVIWKISDAFLKQLCIPNSHSSVLAIPHTPPNFLFYFIYLLLSIKLPVMEHLQSFFGLLCLPSVILCNHSISASLTHPVLSAGSISLLCKILSCLVKWIIFLLLKIILCLLQNFSSCIHIYSCFL